MANLLQMRRMLRNRMAASSSDQFFKDDVLDDALNNALATFESERNWPWQLQQSNIVTTDATGDVAVPTDWRATRSVWCQGDLSEVAPYDLLERDATIGTPAVFAMVGTTMKLWPYAPAGTTIKLIYARQPTLLVNDNDSPQMPALYYPALIAKAAQLASVREDDRAAAGTHLLEYQQWLERLNMTTVQSTRPKGRRIRPGSWV